MSISICCNLKTVSLEDLKPPVSNRVLKKGTQLQLMLVGGPNQRDDFHVEDGEELFFQYKGSMNLDLMQDNERRRLAVSEGEMFVLPIRVPHSPQRYANSAGIVVERVRREDELDSLRWYLPGENAEVLYEEKFHCDDLGPQLSGVISRFMSSDIYQKNTFPKNKDYAPVVLNGDKMPFPLMSILEKKRELSEEGLSSIVSSEFRVTSLIAKVGGSSHVLSSRRDLVIICLIGSATLSPNSQTENEVPLEEYDVVFVSLSENDLATWTLHVHRQGDAVVLIENLAFS